MQRNTEAYPQVNGPKESFSVTSYFQAFKDLLSLYCIQHEDALTVFNEAIIKLNTWRLGINYGITKTVEFEFDKEDFFKIFDRDFRKAAGIVLRLDPMEDYVYPKLSFGTTQEGVVTILFSLDYMGYNGLPNSFSLTLTRRFESGKQVCSVTASEKTFEKEGITY